MSIVLLNTYRVESFPIILQTLALFDSKIIYLNYPNTMKFINIIVKISLKFIFQHSIKIKISEWRRWTNKICATECISCKQDLCQSRQQRNQLKDTSHTEERSLNHYVVAIDVWLLSTYYWHCDGSVLADAAISPPELPETSSATRRTKPTPNDDLDLSEIGVVCFTPRNCAK